jgi:hypothetical protein
VTRDELLLNLTSAGETSIYVALRAVVELCNKWETKGSYCLPIEDVIKAIEKELK